MTQTYIYLPSFCGRQIPARRANACVKACTKKTSMYLVAASRYGQLAECPTRRMRQLGRMAQIRNQSRRVGWSSVSKRRSFFFPPAPKGRFNLPHVIYVVYSAMKPFCELAILRVPNQSTSQLLHHILCSRQQVPFACVYAIIAAGSGAYRLCVFLSPQCVGRKRCGIRICVSNNEMKVS